MILLLSFIAVIVMFAFLYVSLFSYRNHGTHEDRLKTLKAKLILIAIIVALEVISLVFKINAHQSIPQMFGEIILIPLWVFNGYINWKEYKRFKK